MANDVTDFLRQQLAEALQDALGGEEKKNSDGGGLGGKGMLAGAALAALTPMAKRGFEAYRSGQLEDFVSKLGTGQALEEVRSRFGDDDEEEQSRNGKPRAEQEQGEDREPRAEGAEGDDEPQDDDDREPAGGP